MTTALILHRGELAAFSYEEWLADYPGDLVLLASAEKLRNFSETLPASNCISRFRHVEAFENYDTSHVIERRAVELGRRFGASHVVSCAEFDVERAARLREILGVPGQRHSSARSFRDKVTMKTHGARAMNVGHFRSIETVGELANFAKRHGFPLVVKPRNGSASVDVRVLRSFDDVRAIARGLGAEAHRQNLMVETFTEGTMYHVDGLVLGGHIQFLWPSRYATSTLGYLEGIGLASQMLESSDPLTPRLQDSIRQLLAAFPLPGDTTVHAEVFHTPSDELVLCEIASRTGGARVKETLQASFGVNVTEEWVRAQCELPPRRAQVITEPPRLAGWALLTPRRGVVAEMPALPDHSWVAHASSTVGVGTKMGDAVSSVDHVAAFVVTGHSEQEVEERLDQCIRSVTEGWTVIDVESTEA